MGVSDRIAQIFGFPANMGGGQGLQFGSQKTYDYMGGAQGVSLPSLAANPDMGGGTGLDLGMVPLTMPQAAPFNPAMLLAGSSLLQPQQAPRPAMPSAQAYRGQPIPIQQLIQMYRGGGLLK